MSRLDLSRRSFLKTSACSSALIAVGSSISMNQWKTKAYAEENVKVSSSTCNACSNKCGMHVYSKQGRLWKVKGDKKHPYSRGTLCARGHGFATNAYTNSRLTSPMKRTADGNFEGISWEQAYKEIGDKVKDIIANHGPQALAMTQDPRPSGAFYAGRFIKAFGSANFYTHASACNLSRNTGWEHVLKKIPSPDFSAAECVMFIGRSYGDGIRPSSAYALANERERGLHVIMVDPRYNSTAHMCQEWLAIRPGTDLALILALSHVLVYEALYDKDFVARYTTGFDEYKEALKDYTPSWAEIITTIPAKQIEACARKLAKHAPRSFIEQGWRGGMGCAYKNSTECGRAMALFNALLGCYGKKGGMIWTSGVKLGALEDETLFKKLPEPVAPQYGSKEYPLAPKSTGIAGIVPLGCERGDIKGAFYYNSNPVMGYGNGPQLGEKLRKAELLVVIDVQMSETACLADYVLPDTTYLERKEVPATVGGKQPIVDLRLQSIDKVHENTRPVDQIFTELAQACGIGEYFNFTLDDVIDAQLAPFDDKTCAEIKEKGIAALDKPFGYPEEPQIPTEDGLIHFADDLWLKAGLKRTVEWIEPKFMPDPQKKDEFRLIAGKQSIHSHTMTTNVPLLIQISKDYQMERVWINAQRAEKLGIKDGDLIEISSDLGSSQVNAHVTHRIHPDCIWTPSHYGVQSPYLTAGAGMGIGSMDHTPFDFEPASGACMSQENLVRVKKVEV